MRPSKRLLTDPLLWFLLLGGGVFLLWDRLAPEPETIVVTPRVEASLVTDFLLQEGRPPTQAERETLVSRWVEDRILFLEALERGLHRDDPRIEHRLVDKLRFLLTDEPPDPTEAQLRAHHAAHGDRYRTDTRLTFAHRYFPDPSAVPEDALARLQAGEDVTAEPFWLGDRFQRYDAAMLRTLFGVPFVQAVEQAPEGRWVGPLRSTRGVHFVRLDALAPPQAIPFERAREQVRLDWIEARRHESLEARLAELRADYRVERAE